jgi:hypothetical protein
MITKLGTRARAALAQPAPEPVGELVTWSIVDGRRVRICCTVMDPCSVDDWRPIALTVLDRLAQPAPEPLPTLEEAFTTLGYQYGEEAMSNVRVGWDLRGRYAQSQPAPEPPTEGDAHELWALAQLLPGEGIEDGVDRLVTFLSRWGQGNA